MKHLKRFLIFNACLIFVLGVVYLIAAHDYNIPMFPSEKHEELTDIYWTRAYWRYRYSRNVRIRKRFYTVNALNASYLRDLIDEDEALFKDDCYDYDFRSDCVDFDDRWYVIRNIEEMVLYYYDKETRTMYKIRTYIGRDDW